MKRMLALLLALAMMFSLAACGKNDADNGSVGEDKTDAAQNDSTEKTEDKAEDKAESERVIVNGVKKVLDLDPTQTLVTVNGIDLTLGNYLHQFVNVCLRVANSYSMYCVDAEGNLMWDEEIMEGMTTLEYILAATETSAFSYPLTVTLAEKYGVGITPEQIKALEDSLAYEEEQAGSRRDYEADLALTCLSYEDNYQLSKSFYYYDNLLKLFTTEGSELYITDDELYSHEEISEDVIMADHILLKKTEDEERNARLKEGMVAMLDLLKGAEDQEELAEMFSYLGDYYSEDEGRAYYPNGYVFGKGEMVTEFEEAAYALEEYGLSDIVESTYGYHIILRKPLREYIKTEKYEELLIAYREEAEVVWNEELKEKIDFSFFFDEYTNWLERVQASSVVTG